MISNALHQQTHAQLQDLKARIKGFLDYNFTQRLLTLSKVFLFSEALLLLSVTVQNCGHPQLLSMIKLKEFNRS